MEKRRGKAAYAFIDAANLFYGGEKSLRWRLDYKKLIGYLREKFGVSKVFYYAGVDVETYKPEESKKINLDDLVAYYEKEIVKKEKTEAEIVLLGRHLERARFYQDLDKFGYDLRIKPTKVFTSTEGTVTTKANCDVDLTFDMMRFMSQYSEAVVLSGDGDFAPVLEYLKDKKKKITVLARFERTAWEIKALVGEDFIDFKSIRESVEAEKVRKEKVDGLPRRKYTPVNNKVNKPVSTAHVETPRAKNVKKVGEKKVVRDSRYKRKIPVFRKGF